MEPWEETETVAFTHTMSAPELLREGDTRWCISRETTHRPTGRVYQEWPVRQGGAPPRLFIHPETKALTGSGMGPAVHVAQRFSEVGGLRIPEDWSTFMNREAIGHHAAPKVDLCTSFDEAKLEMPSGARVVAGS